MIGGFENNLIPAFAMAAIWVGLAYGGLLRLASKRTTRAAIDVAILALLVIQFLPVSALWRHEDAAKRNPFWYRPAAQQPAPGSLERGRELVAWIADKTDPVYVPHHVYLSRLAGKELDYGIEAVRDLNYSGIPTPRALLDRLQKEHYRYILLDGELKWEWLPVDVAAIIKQRYVPIGSPLPNYEERQLMPVTGAPMKPQLVFEWKN